MADGFDIRIDTRDFQAAMKEFAAFDKRTLPEIVTAKLGDLAFESAKVVKRTTVDAVEKFRTGIPRKFWRYINKLYSKTGVETSRKRRARGSEIGAVYIDPATREARRRTQWINERVTLGGKNAAAGGFDSRFNGKYWRDMIRTANLVMRRRQGRVKSLVGLFLKAAHMLGKRVQSSDLGKNAWKTSGINAAKAIPSEGGRVRAFFTLPIRALLRETGEGNRSAREQTKVGYVNAALESAKASVIADMRAKTLERYQRECDRINARGRAA